MSAKVVSPPVGREVVDVERYHEYWGGLGDIINHIYWLPCYQALMTMPKWERACIVVSSHNPHAKELWLWHPKARQITVCDVGFHCSFQDPNSRDPLGLRRDGCRHDFPFTPVEFYPPKKDLETLSLKVDSVASGGGKYVVFATSSAEKDKFVPEEIVKDAARRTIQAGFTIVVVGKNYIHHNYGIPRPTETWRTETRLWEDPKIVDLVDQLTVPGVMKTVQGAAGIFTAHSACCMAAYHMKKPTFVLYNEHAKKTYLPKPGENWQGYFHGAGNPGCDNAWYPEYTGERMDRWLAGLKELVR